MRIRDVFRAVGWIICTLIPGRGVREAAERGGMLADRLAPQDFHPDLAPTAAGDPVGAGPAAVSVPPTPPAAGHFHPDVMVFDEVYPGAVSGAAGRGLMPPSGASALLDELTELIDEHKPTGGWPLGCTGSGCSWRGFSHASHVAQLVVDAVDARPPRIHIEHYNAVTSD